MKIIYNVSDSFFFNLLTVGTSANGWTVFFSRQKYRGFAQRSSVIFPLKIFSYPYLYIVDYHWINYPEYPGHGKISYLLTPPDRRDKWPWRAWYLHLIPHPPLPWLCLSTVKLDETISGLKFFFPLFVFGGTEVPIVYILLCHPSENSLQGSAILMAARLRTSSVRYHCGGWSEEVNSCILNSYMVYL